MLSRCRVYKRVEALSAFGVQIAGGMVRFAHTRTRIGGESIIRLSSKFAAVPFSKSLSLLFQGWILPNEPFEFLSGYHNPHPYRNAEVASVASVRR